VKRRALRTKLLAVGISTLASLIIIECGARVLFKDPLVEGKTDWKLSPEDDGSLGPRAFYESLRYPSATDRWGPPYREDPEVGFALEPDTAMVMTFSEAPGGAYRLRTNALGLRDERALVPKSAGTLRVLALGDSMTFGLGVEREEAWPAVLERSLSKKIAPRPVEVVNAGVSCWGQCEEVAFLEHRARALEPDLVVLEFTVANDVLDDLRYREENGRLVPDPSLARELEQHAIFENPFALHSRAFRLFVWHTGRHIVRYEVMLAPERLARASQLIRRARDVARGIGAELVLLVAPPSFQVEGGLAERVLGSRRLDDAILAQAERDGIAALDAGDSLRAATRAGRTPYFARDMHWNPSGHEVVGEATAEWLVHTGAVRTR
jgi:lysophospholipase L1-like esterase